MVLIAVSWSLPAFTDQHVADELLGLASAGEPMCHDPGWWDRMDAVRTAKWPLSNAGGALVLGSLTLLIGRRLIGVRSFADLASARTPKKLWVFFAAGLLSLCGYFYASMQSLVLDLQRDYLKPCSDSIAIGMGGLVVAGIISGLLALGIGVVISRWFAPLPVPLRAWDTARQLTSMTWTLVSGLFGAGILLAVSTSLTNSTFLTIPPLLVMGYLTAATRAALCSPRSR